MNPKVQTLEDIARLAGVSTSTVSRALNDSSLINDETKERIQKIAREHHFRINASARNLRVKQSHTIAFVMPASETDFFFAESLFSFEILGGIGKGLRSLGYDLLMIHVDPTDDGWVSSYFDSNRADGFILKALHMSDLYVDRLIEANAPFISWGVSPQNHSYPTVTGDDITGGRLATQHLIDIGREKIAFLGGPKDDLTVHHRFGGYQAALQGANRSVDSDLVVYGDYSHDSGVATMQRLLERRPDVDAVFANSDLMAIGAIKVIRESGKEVPDEIAVVGYDDVSIAKYNNLPLTTVRQNISLSGRLLAENLIQYIQAGIVTNVTTPVELIVRESA